MTVRFDTEPEDIQAVYRFFGFETEAGRQQWRAFRICQLTGMLVLCGLFLALLVAVGFPMSSLWAGLLTAAVGIGLFFSGARRQTVVG